MIEAALFNVDWQNMAALVIVFAALAGLARRVCRLFGSQPVTGCASACSGCPAGAKQAATLVQLKIRR